MAVPQAWNGRVSSSVGLPFGDGEELEAVGKHLRVGEGFDVTVAVEVVVSSVMAFGGDSGAGVHVGRIGRGGGIQVDVGIPGA